MMMMATHTRGRLVLVVALAARVAALVPTAGVPRPRSLFTARETRPVVLFDGVCPRCNAWVNFLVDHDASERLRFAPIGSPLGQRLMDHLGLPRDLDAILLVTRDEYFLKSEAFFRILEETDLHAVGTASRWLFPTPVGDALLRANRDVFGETDRCRLDDLDDRFLSELPFSSDAASSSPSDRARACFDADARPVFVYDGACRGCDAFVNVLLRYDRRATLRFAAAQTQAGRALKTYAGLAPDADAVVLVADDRRYVNADALLQSFADIDADDPLVRAVVALGLALPQGLKDACFDFVSKRRYDLFGSKFDFCRVSEADAKFAGRFLVAAP